MGETMAGTRIAVMALLLLAGCAAPQSGADATLPAPAAPSAWLDPDAARAGGASECREYEERVTIGGVPQVVHGTACRAPDGSWRKQ